MEIVDDRAAPQVEEILPLAAIASAPPLPVADMRQGMLDGDALAELGGPAGVCWRWRSSARKRSSGWR